MTRYCWYNTETKQFSDSWVDGAWGSDVDELKNNLSSNWVLVKYEVITNHPDFTIDDTMGVVAPNQEEGV